MLMETPETHLNEVVRIAVRLDQEAGPLTGCRIHVGIEPVVLSES